MGIVNLPWDSQLFGYRVGKVEVSQLGFDLLGFLEQALVFRLVYVISEKPILSLPENTILVDTKVTFEKAIYEIDSLEGIEFFEGELSEKLISLAFQSGNFSRFKTDERLSNKEFEKLYLKWLERDLKTGKIIVHKIADEIVGMITLSFHDSFSSIGLLAVDFNYRGKGIGDKLLKMAESISGSLGLKKISVQTQLKNSGAMRFYKQIGFEKTEEKFIYHYYNQLGS